jgi:hypothetical protein
MLRTRRVRAAAVVTGIAAVALAGCAVMHAPAKVISRPAANPARAVSASTRTPKGRAEADTVAMLKAFAPPPGARRLSRSPASALDEQPPPPPSAEPDYVARTEWWIAPGNPRQVLAWETKHLPAPFQQCGGGSAKAWWDADCVLPDVPGVLTDRQLNIVTTAVGHGQTGIQVSSSDQWIPARPATEVIPPAARVVTITMTDSTMTGNTVETVREPKPVTVANPAEVRRIAALLDGLPLILPEPYGCPSGGNGDLTLVFTARTGAPALATVTAELTGCAFIDLTIGGTQQPELGPGGAGRTFARQAIKVAGLNWKLPL